MPFRSAAIAEPRKWGLENRENHWSELTLSSPGKRSIQGWARRDDFLREMDRAGIDRSVLLGWYWENTASCHCHNEHMAGWLRSHPDRFQALACVHPLDPNLETTLTRIGDQGFRGIGEILPALQSSSLRDPFWDRVAEWAAAHGFPINLHVSEPVGRDHPGRVPTPPDDIVSFAQKHPELPLILSHWGGGLFLHELNPHIKQALHNTWYDCSASPLLFDPLIFDLALQSVGEEKMLFGSDFPLRLYPRRQKTPEWTTFLGELDQRGWSPRSRPGFFGENAARLFTPSRPAASAPS